MHQTLALSPLPLTFYDTPVADESRFFRWFYDTVKSLSERNTRIVRRVGGKREECLVTPLEIGHPCCDSLGIGGVGLKMVLQVPAAEPPGWRVALLRLFGSGFSAGDYFQELGSRNQPRPK